MRGDELVVLTKVELAQLQQRAARTGDLFDATEMQAISEQYETRIALLEARREEVEWKLRLELAKIRDAKEQAQRAADELRHIEERLQALASDGDSPARAEAVPAERFVADTRPRFVA